MSPICTRRLSSFTQCSGRPTGITLAGGESNGLLGLGLYEEETKDTSTTSDLADMMFLQKEQRAIVAHSTSVLLRLGSGTCQGR